MKDLEIKNYDEAADGPGSFELLEILAAVEEPNEDAVINATRRMGQLATMLDAIEAASELEGRALAAAEDVLAVGKLTVPKGHQGEAVPVIGCILGGLVMHVGR